MGNIEKSLSQFPFLTLTVFRPSNTTLNQSELFKFCYQNQDDLLAILHNQGAILFTGFRLLGSQALTSVKQAIFGNCDFSYVDGNSPRTQLSAGIYTSTEFPKEYDISLHSEMSYSRFWPSYILFQCEQPARNGGLTILGDTRNMIETIDLDVLSVFSQRGICYTRFLPKFRSLGKSWIDTFQTDSRTTVESFCDTSGISYLWHGEDLYLSQRSLATLVHPKTGRTSWFNQALQFHPYSLPSDEFLGLNLLFQYDKKRYPHYSYFSDGSEIPLSYLDEIRRVEVELSSFVSLEVGDVLILDNINIAHGRTSYMGDRRVMVSMC